MEEKVKVIFSYILRAGQGLFGGYAAIQVLMAAYGIARKNAQKKQEAMDHLPHIGGAVLLAALAEPVVQFLQAV